MGSTKWNFRNKIKCSAGTYIRSIARDLGNFINSEGCLLTLKEFQLADLMNKIP